MKRALIAVLIGIIIGTIHFYTTDGAVRLKATGEVKFYLTTGQKMIESGIIGIGTATLLILAHIVIRACSDKNRRRHGNRAKRHSEADKE